LVTWQAPPPAGGGLETPGELGRGEAGVVPVPPPGPSLTVMLELPLLW
jgi:hypothetical protein